MTTLLNWMILVLAWMILAEAQLLFYEQSSPGSSTELVSKYFAQKQSSHVIRSLTLQDYILARKTICANSHPTQCDSLLISANSILENGSGILSEIFRKAFPGTKYTAEVAKRRFLQMPLVTILVGDPSSGRSLTYLIESQHGTNYQTIQNLLSSRIKEKGRVDNIRG